MRKQYNKTAIHRYFKIGIVLICIILFYKICIVFSPFHLRENNIYKIGLSIEYSAENQWISGHAIVENKNDIKEAVQILNKIKAYRGFYSIDDLPGESPSARVTVYKSETDLIGTTIMIYYDIIATSDGKYYKIDLSEHNKISDLCKKYGECRYEKN